MVNLKKFFNFKRKSPTKLIENIENPELESVYIKFPRGNLINISMKRKPDSVYENIFKEWLSYLIKDRKSYSHIHTHPDSPPIPSPIDLYNFLRNNRRKSMTIAFQYSKTGQVLQYFIIRKTKKTPILSKEGKEDLYEKTKLYGKKFSSISLEELKLKKPRELEEIFKYVKKTLDKYNLHYKVIDTKNSPLEGGKNLESKLTLIITIVGLAGALFFLSPNLTGNAVANASKTSSNWIGIVLLLIGFVGGYFYFKNRI